MMLHKAFDDAVRWNIVARNVCDMIDVPQRAHHEIRPLTIEQAKRLLEAAKGHPLEALFGLALTTGLRRGEILALKWRDIDIEKRTVQIQRIFTRAPGNRYIEAEPKTKKSRRSVKLTARVVDLLNQHRKRQGEAHAQADSQWTDNDLVFCTSIGTPVNPSKLLERFSTLLKKAGLPHMRFHDLRHSAATILLAMNVHPKIVQELLGHHQISMTMDLYSHVLPGLQDDVIDKLGDLLEQSENVEDGNQRTGRLVE
jgi:integrase